MSPTGKSGEGHEEGLVGTARNWLKGLRITEVIDQFRSIEREESEESSLRRMRDLRNPFSDFSAAQPYQRGTAQRAQNTPPRPQPKVREPWSDLFDEGETISIVADLPGVALSDIGVRLNFERTNVAISTTIEDYRYYKRVDLPAPVNAASQGVSLNNGLLTVCWEKASANAVEETISSS